MEKNALWPLYLPMEIEILLSMERDIHLIAHGTNSKIWRTQIFKFKKDVLLPVETAVLNCLLRNIILCTLASGEKDFFCERSKKTRNNQLYGILIGGSD